MYNIAIFVVVFGFYRYFDFKIINAKIVTLYKNSINHTDIQISRLYILLFKTILIILSYINLLYLIFLF